MDADKYTLEITSGELAGWGLHLERADFEVQNIKNDDVPGIY